MGFSLYYKCFVVETLKLQQLLIANFLTHLDINCKKYGYKETT